MRNRRTYQTTKESVRQEYALIGVDTYYKLHALDYQNPHFLIIKKLINYAYFNWGLGNTILDLCCGSGEISLVLSQYPINCIGCDFYTTTLYQANTHNLCYTLSFKDIACTGINIKVDTIICSFALHLCERSLLPTVLYQLSRISRQLIILTPHKRPDCEIMGWHLTKFFKLDGVTMKLYIHDQNSFS